jgi:hypothetical protein
MLSTHRSATPLAKVANCTHGDVADSNFEVIHPVGPKNSAEIERGILWPIEMKENKWVRLLAFK